MMELFLIAILIIIALVGSVGAWLEKSEWNNGIAPSGKRWQYFDTTSQGGRGYKDPNGPHVIWISYPFIDRNYRKNMEKDQ